MACVYPIGGAVPGLGMMGCFKMLHSIGCRRAEAALPWKKPALHSPPAFHGFEHGDFVGVFDVAAYRNSHGDPGYAQSLPLELLGQIGGGGFSLDGGIGGQDDFFDFAAADPADQV